MSIHELWHGRALVHCPERRARWAGVGRELAYIAGVGLALAVVMAWLVLST